MAVCSTNTAALLVVLPMPDARLELTARDII
jgi:hypothetical protein